MKFCTGDGVTKNLKTGIYWLEKAVLLGSNEAKLQLRKYKNYLERLKNPPAVYVPDDQQNSITEIAKDSVRIIDLNQSINSSIEMDLINSQENQTGESFSDVDQAMTVLVVENNPDKAKDLLEKLALGGNSEASRQLALIHYKDKNFNGAKKWFERSASRNDVPSLRYLGILYFFGQGVNQDYQAADIWFSQAAKLGDVESSRYLKAVKQFY